MIFIKYFEIGKIINTRGLKGEMKIFCFGTDIKKIWSASTREERKKQKALKEHKSITNKYISSVKSFRITNRYCVLMLQINEIILNNITNNKVSIINTLLDSIVLWLNDLTFCLDNLCYETKNTYRSQYDSQIFFKNNWQVKTKELHNILHLN